MIMLLNGWTKAGKTNSKWTCFLLFWHTNIILALLHMRATKVHPFFFLLLLNVLLTFQWKTRTFSRLKVVPLESLVRLTVCSCHRVQQLHDHPLLHCLGWLLSDRLADWGFLKDLLLLILNQFFVKVSEDWDEYEDSPSGRKFYFNSATKEKSWKPPRKSKGSEGTLVVETFFI